MGLFRRRFACLLALACGAGAILACDPREPPPVAENGPAFLTVGLADHQQADGSDGGTTFFVQSRGGNYISVRTIGCTHAFGPYAGVTESCGQTPYYSAQPFYVTADPEEEPCRLEVRLYSICDCFEGGLPFDYTNGPDFYTWCDSAGTPVSSEVVTIGPPGLEVSLDGGAIGDGAGQADSSHGTGDF
jgi:hypothetical protein